VVFVIIVGLALAAAQCSPQFAQPAAQPAAAENEKREEHPDEEEHKEVEADAARDEDEPATHTEGEREEMTAHLEDLAPIPLAAGEKLHVVATTNIVGDVVGVVGGEAIDLTTLLPIGSDPHTFVPAPQDVAAVAEAHVVFINGLGLEEFLGELIENAGGEAVIVSLSEGVEAREFGQGEGQDHEEEEEHQDEDEHGHSHEGLDAHAWLSPANVMVWTHNLEMALSALDPANHDHYEENAAAYEAELAALDEWVAAQIATIPAENRELVTDHDALGYYADRYGLEVVGAVIPAYSTNAEPSAQELAELQEVIAELEVKAVFVGTTVNPALAERVAEDTGIKLVPLYTGSLGEAGSGVETYLDYIRYNTTAIVEGLK
jgi:ABC-type Zn uptake system ZnuABC Zn-binding protein ZnuA